ncbi:MAG: monovalent cation/H+ antiporter complex subunit F [Gemmobacter sp.]
MTPIATEVGGVLGVAIGIAALMLLVSLVATVWRLLRGPTGVDRVIAADLLAVHLIVLLVVFSLASGVRAYIYVAIALALIAFLSTVAFARYIERAHGGPHA